MYTVLLGDGDDLRVKAGEGGGWHGIVLVVGTAVGARVSKRNVGGLEQDARPPSSLAR